MYSKLDICNRALRMIGENRIISLDESSRAAEECSFLYPIVKREVIESYPWKCTQRTIMLHCIVDKEAEEICTEYSNKFLLPYDCIRVLTINDEPYFHRDGLYLYSNKETIALTYCSDIDEKYMTIRLKKLISLKLASELGNTLLGNENILINIANKINIEYKHLTQLDSQEGEINHKGIHFNDAYTWLKARE